MAKNTKVPKENYDRVLANSIIAFSALSLVSSIIIFASYDANGWLIALPLFVESLTLCLGIYMRLQWKLPWLPFILIVGGATLAVWWLSSFLFILFFQVLGVPDLLNNTTLLNAWRDQ